MKKVLVLIWAALLTTSNVLAQHVLVHATPEEEGVHSSDVQTYLDKLMNYSNTSMHGVIVMRHGRIIAEAYNNPFQAKFCHTLYSASKTVSALAVGLCIEDQKLHLDDHVAQYLLDELPRYESDSLHMLTIRDLLTMESGLPVRYTTLRKDSSHWVRALLGQHFTHLPGTHFAYDSMDTYLLSAIVQRATGEKMFNLLDKRIFAPLGIDKIAWEESPEGVDCGGWGLYMRLEDMAKIGKLLLDYGKWNGEQLIDSEWIRQMSEEHVESSKYGYQVWCTPRKGTYKADGAYGQYIFVIPDKDMVICMLQNQLTNLPNVNAGSEEWLFTNQFLNKITSDKSLPASPSEYSKLQDACKHFHLPYTKGQALSTKHNALFRKPITIQLAENDLGWESVRITQEIGKDKNMTTKLTVTTQDKKTYAIECGYQRWITNKIKGHPLVYNDRQAKNGLSNITNPFYCAGSYGWYGNTGEDLYVRLHWVNWISGCRLHFQFKGNTITAVHFRPGYSYKEVSIPVFSR